MFNSFKKTYFVCIFWIIFFVTSSCGSEQDNEGVANQDISAEQIGLSPDEWLDIHNQERCIFGTKPLLWDPELAISSLAYANTLKSKLGCNIAHNVDDSNQGDRGENLALNYGIYTTELKAASAYNVVSERWCESEKQYCNLTTATCQKEANHFTQVVSNRTTHVGCAQISFTYQNGQMQCHLQVCRYRPAGNMYINGNRVPIYDTPWQKDKYNCCNIR